MLRAWSIPNANNGECYMDFPELQSDDADTQHKVELWNKMLTQNGDNLKIITGASTEIVLHPHSTWF